MITFRYVLHLIFFGPKNSRTKFCTNISNGNIAVYLLCSLFISSLFFPAQSEKHVFLPSIKYRGSLPEVFCKQVILKHFAKFTEKQKSTCFGVPFSIKRLQHRCFLVKFAKFLRTLFYRAAPMAASENGVISIWLTTSMTSKVPLNLDFHDYF